MERPNGTKFLIRHLKGHVSGIQQFYNSNVQLIYIERGVFDKLNAMMAALAGMIYREFNAQCTI